ncbi:MAG: DUF1853 family protein [Planctomycetota bacterium]
MSKWNPEQLTSDLEWVISSPSLLDSKALPTFEFPPETRTRFQAVDSSDLTSFMDEQCRSHRVGDYFEALVHFALRELAGFNISLAHHQIFDGPRTIGEIDFLLEDSLGRSLHLEVAVKFFLHLGKVAGLAGERALIGPNPADNLHRKLEHLQRHQLPLSERLEHQVDDRKLMMLGRVHHHFLAKPAMDCRQLSSNHLDGIWCRHSEIRDLVSSYAKSMFRLQRKPFWLSRELNPEWLAREELLARIEKHFLASTSSLLFSIMEEDAAKDLASVETPVFVVSDTWPEVERSA